MLEKVSEDGKEISGAEGRLINPGHGIEAGWFLLQYATRKQNYELARIAIDKFIVQSFEIGWDDMYGGIIYMLDANGHSPTQLEWNMKLWWPHAEALIAFLMAYKETKDERFIEKFDRVFHYTFAHVSDGILFTFSPYLVTTMTFVQTPQELSPKKSIKEFPSFLKGLTIFRRKFYKPSEHCKTSTEDRH